MRCAALAVISALTLAACGQNAPAPSVFPNLFQTAYRAEATITAEDGQTIPVVMIRDGDKQRMEFNAPQGRMVVIHNGESGEQVALMTIGDRTVAMSGGVAGAVSDPAENWNADMTARATRVGPCAGAGQTGTEWADAESNSSTCVTNDGIILSSTQDGRQVWQTTSVTRGPQSPDLFVVPPGVEAMDMSAILGPAMQQQLQQTPAGQGGGEAAGRAALCQALRGQNAPADVLSRAGC